MNKDTHAPFEAELTQTIYEKIKGIDTHRALAVITNEFVSEKTKNDARLNIIFLLFGTVFLWLLILTIVVLR